MTGTSMQLPSGEPLVDGLLWGTRWGAPSVMSERPVTLTYSFPQEDAVWASLYGDDEPRSGFQAFGEEEKEAARGALSGWAEVADIRFEEVSETDAAGDLRFAYSARASVAHAYLPFDGPEAGDVWLDPDLRASDAFAPGAFGYYVLLHEIGHALGLKHPHEKEGIGDVIPTRDDWLGQTVMSYRATPGASLTGDYGLSFYPEAPMALDIGAIQYLYGANPTTNAGDTVYAFKDGEAFATLYDTGGVDVIDWSGQTSGALIDLRPDAWSELGAPLKAGGKSIETTVRIFEQSEIENAIGGAGDDELIGNGLDNRLEGLDGKDLLRGLDGDDTLLGGEHNDKLWGDAGDDLLAGGAGKNKLDGGGGVDVAVFEGEIDDFKIKLGKKKIKVKDTDPDDGDQGTAKLVSIEVLAFEDETMAVEPAGEALIATVDLDAILLA